MLYGRALRSRLQAIMRCARAMLAAAALIACPVAASSAEDHGTLQEGAIIATPPSATVGEGVHFALAPDAFAELAAAADVGVETLRREAEYAWRFSQASEENYVFDALPDDMRGPRMAGEATGPFAGHVYRTAGAHEVEATVRFRGETYRAAAVVAVAADRTPATRIATVDPEGRRGDAPPHRLTFQDLDEALLALERGAVDRLLLRRGATHRLDGVVDPRTGARRASYRISGSQSIDAYGDPALGPPIITPVFGERGLEAYQPRLRATGDGARTTFQTDGLAAGAAAVYVDGRRLEEGRDYAIEGGVLAFASPPASAARILAFRSRDGFLEARNTALLQVVEGRGARLRNFEIRGPYDPAAPGVFDPERLDTFEHAVHFEAVMVRGRSDGVTLSDLRLNGLRNGVLVLNGGERVFVVNCAVRNWHDYGVYLNVAVKMAVIGSDISQAVGAHNGPGYKTANRPGVANYADHGPLRTPVSVEMVVNRSRLSSRTSWTATATDSLDTQPAARLAAAPRSDLSFSITESHATGSISVGVSNAWSAVPRMGLLHLANNWIEAGVAGRWFVHSIAPFTSISNVYLLHEAAGRLGFQAFGFFDGKDYVVAEDASADPPLSINDSYIILAQRPEAPLVFSRPYPLASRGVTNVVSLQRPDGAVGAFVVAQAGRSVAVPVRVPPIPAIAQFSWRIWRVPAGAGTEAAAAFDTLAEQSAAYRIDDSAAERPSHLDEVIITLEAGRFEAGERLIVTRELTQKPPEDDAGPDAKRFFMNNLSKPFVLPPVEFWNPLIVVEGEWREIRILEDEPPVPAAALRASRYAPLDLFYRPLPGSPALGAARGPRIAARDFRGASRPSPAALGALEPGTDLTGFVALPAAPGPVALDWKRPPRAGAPPDASDVRVTFSDPGRPPLRPEDVDIRFEIEGRRLEPREPATPRSGEMVRAMAWWPHVTGPGVALAPPAVAGAAD